jgi:hypothetical protein
MLIYLNDKEITQKYKSLELPDILDEIKNNFENEILQSILVNDVEINEKYFKETLIEKKNIKKLEFVTKKTEDLIKETIKEASRYLPKLKRGINDTVSYFRNGKEKQAHDNYQLVLDGLEWYTSAIIKILSLLDEQKLYNMTEKKIKELNKPLTDMMVAHNKKDYVLVADILEYEILDYIDRFIAVNKKTRKIIQNESVSYNGS